MKLCKAIEKIFNRKSFNSYKIPTWCKPGDMVKYLFDPKDHSSFKYKKNYKIKGIKNNWLLFDTQPRCRSYSFEKVNN